MLLTYNKVFALVENGIDIIVHLHMLLLVIWRATSIENNKWTYHNLSKLNKMWKYEFNPIPNQAYWKFPLINNWERFGILEADENLRKKKNKRGQRGQSQRIQTGMDNTWRVINSEVVDKKVIRDIVVSVRNNIISSGLMINVILFTLSVYFS